MGDEKKEEKKDVCIGAPPAEAEVKIKQEAGD